MDPLSHLDFMGKIIMKKSTSPDSSESTDIEQGTKGSPVSKYPKETTEQEGLVGVNEKSNKKSHSSSPAKHRPWVTTVLSSSFILFLGLGTSAAFLAFGIKSANQEQEDSFERDAIDLGRRIKTQFHEYVNAASLIHSRCRNRDFTRNDFRQLYEYIVDSGLSFKAMQFDPNVTHEEREAHEAEARAFYAEYYPHVNYRGFVSFVPNSTNTEPRSKQPFYFPIHYQEPIPGNEIAIDLDYYSIASRRVAVDAIMETGQPATTGRLKLVRDPNVASRCDVGDLEASFGVVLMHPGVNVSTSQEVWPRDFSSIVICIPSLLRTSTLDQSRSSSVYLYDSSSSATDPIFLGGVQVRTRKDQEAELTYLEETPLKKLRGSKLYRDEELVITNRVWTIAVVAWDDTYEASHVYVIVGGVIIFLASVCLALWVCTTTRREMTYNELKTQAEADKAATQAERELNDFIAHEVRNPVAAAMTAASFVKMEINKANPLSDKNSKEQTIQDFGIIDSSLKFVYDLLRTMLDMHRAKNGQMHLNKAPTDILHDVLEPVEGMLVQRGQKVAVSVDCPKDLFAVTDSLRLKQVLLNLGRNSAKFVKKGFIRLSCAEVDGYVQLSVEDSGPGVPLEKQDRLFVKFQESLDVLNQGTGIGLFLCKNLVDLMDGELYLDKSYDSGVPGCPGSRFVINLKVPSIPPPPDLVMNDKSANASSTSLLGEKQPVEASPPTELPETLSVLFTDDDSTLRKLFSRAVKRVAPGWTIREAASGETALQITETEDFDLIFMDMYMASVEKQLLGSETVARMRQKGINCRICGLSANDMKDEFMEAGADCFTMKPLPCKKDELKTELCRILNQGQQKPGEVSELATDSTTQTLSMEKLAAITA